MVGAKIYKKVPYLELVNPGFHFCWQSYENVTRCSLSVRNNEPAGVSRNKPADEKEIKQLFEQCLGSEKFLSYFLLNIKHIASHFTQNWVLDRIILHHLLKQPNRHFKSRLYLFFSTNLVILISWIYFWTATLSCPLEIHAFCVIFRKRKSAPKSVCILVVVVLVVDFVQCLPNNIRSSVKNCKHFL